MDRPLPPARAGEVAGAALQRLVSDAFEGFAGGEGHPCLGARSVTHRGALELRVYDRLGGAEAAAALHSDLTRFGEGAAPDELASFVAVFSEPAAMSEERFSALLWRQLQRIHDIDRPHHHWDPRVSADPSDPHFSYSVAGRAYFVIGLHAGSSRWARRFAWPALVFNPHQQFVALRRDGRYERMRSVIRGRDAALQGSVNPVLRDHGAESEARQYAGNAVSASWPCPLRVSTAQ